VPVQDVLCDYLEQVLSGRSVRVNVIYYNMELDEECLVVPGREGGEYGSQQETEHCLRSIATTGGGRFHHFRVSGTTIMNLVSHCTVNKYIHTCTCACTISNAIDTYIYTYTIL